MVLCLVTLSLTDLYTHRPGLSASAEILVCLCRGYNHDSTAIRPPFDSHSAAIRPRYDHSTTYVTTVGLAVCGLLR